MTEAYSARALLGVTEGKLFNLTFSSLPVIPIKEKKKKKVKEPKDISPLKYLVVRL